MKTNLIKFIDGFHFLFAWLMPVRTFRYAVCGGSNLVLDTVLYFIYFQYIFAKQNVDMYFFVLSPHIASLFFVFPITFLTGFWLNKYISFPSSPLSTGIQFYRYFIVGIGALLISYASMKFLVDFLQFFPTPSRLLTIIITVLYSYLLQNKFSFKVDN